MFLFEHIGTAAVDEGFLVAFQDRTRASLGFNARWPAAMANIALVASRTRSRV